MSHIKTADGWKRLWHLSAPTRPVYPDPKKQGQKHAEQWCDEQLQVLLQLRERAQ